MKTAKTEAGKAYKAKRAEVYGLMGKLQLALRKEDKRQRNDGESWGYVGDLGHIAEGLKELVRSMTGE